MNRRRFITTGLAALAVPIIIPPSTPFAGSYSPTPLHLFRKPLNPMVVNVGINWLQDAPTNFCIQYNGNNQLPGSGGDLSQIGSLLINNAKCTSPVDIVFPDSGARITVPALSELCIPGMTGGVIFYAVAETPIPNDVTNIAVCNDYINPFFVPAVPTVITTTSGVSISLSSGGTLPLVGISILKMLDISMSAVNNSSAGELAFTLNLTGLPGGVSLLGWDVALFSNTPIPFASLFHSDDLGLDVTQYSSVEFVCSGNVSLTGLLNINLTHR